MAGTHEQGTSPLTAVSNAMVRLHKEQFGRGPTGARAGFAGPDTLVCVLHDVLLPAERKMVELGDQGRVRDARIAFQAATQPEFIAAVEQIVCRKVVAFASGVDADANVVFETFYFEPRESGSDGDGALAAEGTGELGEDGQVGV
jgi:uncharacterized protein YbcI